MEMYDCAKIGNDDYVKYPVDGDGKIVAVDTINNGKKLNFITAANAQARIGRALRKSAEGESEAVDEDGSSVGDDV